MSIPGVWCTCREGQVLPSLRIPILAPADEHQYVCLKLLDQHRQLLASWNNSTKQQQQQQTQYSCNPGAPLVFQQHMLDAGGQQQVLVGHMQKTVSPQELWVSLPAPGTYYAHVSIRIVLSCRSTWWPTTGMFVTFCTTCSCHAAYSRLVQTWQCHKLRYLWLTPCLCKCRGDKLPAG